MSVSKLNARSQIGIGRSRAEVYEAIVDPEKMAGYFISRGSDRLDAGRPVTWSWSEYGAEATVTPGEMVPHRTIEFHWAPATATNAQRAKTLVTIELQENDNGETTITVCEGNWDSDAAGIARCMEQTQGWMHMLCCLKACLEFDINLRAGIKGVRNEA